MIIYCTNLSFKPENGIDILLKVIAAWIGNKTRFNIDPAVLKQDKSIKFKDKSSVETLSSENDGDSHFPVLYSIRFSHPDQEVAGRQWITEIGIKQETPQDTIMCSILVRTSEISARVVTPIVPTRPFLVEELLKNCKPDSNTAGLHIKTLDENSADAFPYAIDDEKRKVPYIVISPTREGSYLVQVDRILSLVRGISEVVLIPSTSNTFNISRSIGKEYTAWNGAVIILFPSKIIADTKIVDSIRLMPDDLTSTERDIPIETEILSRIIHRTNLPNSWRHISPEVVRQRYLQTQIAKAIEKLKGSPECSHCDYITLLETADSETRSKTQEIGRLNEQLQEKEREQWGFETRIEQLQSALSGRGVSNLPQDIIAGLAQVRDIMADVLDRKPTLEQSLNLIQHLFPDRVIVLETAFTSARKSMFVRKEQAFDLIWKLAKRYWDLANDGEGDIAASTVFGKSFAAREAESLSTDGRRRRTFRYQGQDYFMERHLKIGVKFSSHETFRLYFDWEPEEHKIIIGHCGEHIPF